MVAKLGSTPDHIVRRWSRRYLFAMLLSHLEAMQSMIKVLAQPDERHAYTSLSPRVWSGQGRHSEREMTTGADILGYPTTNSRIF